MLVEGSVGGWGVRWTTRHPAEAHGLDVVLQRVKLKDGAGVRPPHLQVFREEAEGHNLR